VSPKPQLLRGRVYAATLHADIGEKYFLVVSNNQRNRQLPQALAVRISTSAKPSMPSIVALHVGEPVVGNVICDDILELYPDEVRQDLGALSPATMRRVGAGLKVALGLQ
jgi:mRNA interferase MazF